MSAISIPPMEETGSTPAPPNAPRVEAARLPLALWVDSLSVSFDGFKALDLDAVAGFIHQGVVREPRGYHGRSGRRIVGVDARIAFAEVPDTKGAPQNA